MEKNVSPSQINPFMVATGLALKRIREQSQVDYSVISYGIGSNFYSLEQGYCRLEPRKTFKLCEYLPIDFKNTLLLLGTLSILNNSKTWSDFLNLWIFLSKEKFLKGITEINLLDLSDEFTILPNLKHTEYMREFAEKIGLVDAISKFIKK